MDGQEPCGLQVPERPHSERTKKESPVIKPGFLVFNLWPVAFF
jgi:hypothetical protein